MDLVFTLAEIDIIAKKIILLFGDVKVIGINGVMGAGKTTLILAVCKEMGVTDKMSSPTYSIIQQYKTADGLMINHIDVYRLKDTNEAIQAGVQDAVNSGDLCFIEWPEKITAILPLHFIDVSIEPAKDDERKLVVKYN